jgi:hypothetical protein
MPAMSDQKFAEFFAVMSGIFGHKWISQVGTNPDGISARVWRDGLSSLEIPQIAEAIQHYKNNSLSAVWPPSLPEFRLQALGLPSLNAYRHLLATGQVTPFTLLANSFLDAYRLKLASAKEHDALTERAYWLSCEAVEHGAALPEVPVMIEAQPVKRNKAPPTPEQVESIKASIAAAKELLS